MNTFKAPRSIIVRLSLATIPALLLLGGCADSRPAQSFASPDEAVTALVAALGPPLDSEKLNTLLGPEGKEITSSGDSVADANNAEAFVKRYNEKHRLQTNAEGDTELVVGNKDWPLPIPLVKDEKGMWSFDAAAGKDEILRRRIGGNENFTMNVLLAIVDAQREYSQLDPDGDGLANYSPKLISTPGKRDGLYWPTSDGERPSPMGELVGDAAADGYHRNSAGPTAFHGYFYKLLTAQGPAAPGGEMSYADKQGRLLTGFGVIAWPAEYLNSGVMTFMVSADGTVYEQDLGADTAAVVSGIKAYNPGEGWKKSVVPAVDPDDD